MNISPLTMTWVALGALLGAPLRFFCAECFKRWFPSFPWGTWFVNLLGCFLMGMAWSFFKKHSLPSSFHFFFAVGFLGSFTTFSSFALENMLFLESNKMLPFFFNLVSQNVLGLLFVWFGFQLANG